MPSFTSSFTADDLIAKVRQFAAERPLTMYNRPSAVSGCSNVDGVCSDGSTGCIMGQAFTALGLDFGAEFAVGARLRSASVSRVLAELGILTVGLPYNWLTCVQAQQDAGHEWGEAVAVADRRYPLS